MRAGRFFATFLVTFAALLAAWTVSGAGPRLAQGLVAAGGMLGTPVHGWILRHPAGPSAPAVWVRGDDQVPLALHFDALTTGAVTALALLLATPGLRLRRRLRAAATGVALCVGLDIAVVAMFPVLVFYKNAFTDVIGTFIGLVVFVGAPVIVWFVLAVRARPDWLPALRRR